MEYGNQQEAFNTIESSITNSSLNVTHLLDSKVAELEIQKPSFTVSITKIAYKVAGVYVYITFESIKCIVYFVKENPDINYKFVLKLTIVVLLLTIIVPLIKAGVIIYILIKDYLEDRKYKKKIKQLRT